MNIVFIGGTGMLAEAVAKIAKDHSLTIVARNPEPLALKVGAAFVRMDWTDDRSIDIAIDTIKRNVDSVHILISWVHSDGLRCIHKFERILEAGGRSIRIHGSAAGDPEQGIKTDPQKLLHITRQNIVLGWAIEQNQKRWLTHREISDGVIHAFINSAQENFIVGTISD